MAYATLTLTNPVALMGSLDSSFWSHEAYVTKSLPLSLCHESCWLAREAEVNANVFTFSVLAAKVWKSALFNGPE